ncbi:uncharacterized protein LOC116932902 [Daphnia magna]|uniref:uncharacterized protein LOC116932902 n=1 Tax=Daphnia magna TaxID=35525 RepID=UPI001E1BA2BE|nr:uncharacterized protein LOC116932902 [Daphnia magna]
MAEAEAEAIPSSSKDVDVEVVHVESSQTPSSGNKSQARAKASPYVVFVPSKFFKKITSNEKSTVYKCLLGCPSTRTTTVFHSSLMNARRHITTYHRARLSDFNAAFAAGKSAANDKTSPCQSMDKHLVNLKESTTNKQVLTQADLDTKIMKFIIKDSLSIREVEREGFRDLMGSLVGKLVVKKRTYFTERLQTEYSNTKTNLILALESALHVSTTADLWSGRRRSFLGMTVHWLGSDLLRCSACLAVRRVIGSHTFDVIAKLIDSIHKEFGISSKVNCTITDNGSNFLKAFNVFGPNTATSEPEDEDEEDLEDDDDFDFIDIGEIFDRHSQECADKEATTSEESDDDNINVAVTEKERIKLPRHMRCSCHLLNLIATTDVSNISNAAFKKLKRRIEAKLQAIWNKQARSSLASDYIKSKLGVLFVLYNVTRWNSFFDSVECVTKLIGSKNEELAEVFHHFNIAPLTKTEEEFLIEDLD